MERRVTIVCVFKLGVRRYDVEEFLETFAGAEMLEFSDGVYDGPSPVPASARVAVPDGMEEEFLDYAEADVVVAVARME